MCSFHCCACIWEQICSKINMKKRLDHSWEPCKISKKCSRSLFLTFTVFLLKMLAPVYIPVWLNAKSKCHWVWIRRRITVSHKSPLPFFPFSPKSVLVKNQTKITAEKYCWKPQTQNVRSQCMIQEQGFQRSEHSLTILLSCLTSDFSVCFLSTWNNETRMFNIKVLTLKYARTNQIDKFATVSIYFNLIFATYFLSSYSHTILDRISCVYHSFKKNYVIYSYKGSKDKTFICW